MVASVSPETIPDGPDKGLRAVGKQVDLLGRELAAGQLGGKAGVLLDGICPLRSALGFCLRDTAGLFDDAFVVTVGVAGLLALCDEEGFDGCEHVSVVLDGFGGGAEWSFGECAGDDGHGGICRGAPRIGRCRGGVEGPC